jgi:pSer/pThr/pTyr-binding forkhead associated (FHA) protein
MIVRYQYASQKHEFHSSAQELLIGRSVEMPVDVDLSPDQHVSRLHARLYYDLSTWWIEDLRSQNGTTLNGRLIQRPVPIRPSDEIRIGRTILQLVFPTSEEFLAPGVLQTKIPLEQTQSLGRVSEDQQLETLASLTSIMNQSRGQQAMLEGFLREVTRVFPAAKRITIAMIEDREIVPRVFLPPPHSHLSFTLARRAIVSQQALKWVPSQQTGSMPKSLETTFAALYAPMVIGRQAAGVVHLDSTDTSRTFSDRDLQLLGIMATIMGAALRGAENTLERLPSVFLSYAHVDGSYIRRLAADLRRYQVHVWMDERLRSGEAWRKQLEAAIEATDAFVLVVSAASVNSTEVGWERDAAVRLNKPVVPVLIDATPVPEPLGAIQYVTMQPDYAKGLQQLRECLYERRT